MDILIHPVKLHGQIHAIPSKSQAHRLLICAAFSDGTTELICPETNQDIQATANCLNALGAGITRTDNGYTITPVTHIPDQAVLDCGESGSTLRFLLPVAGALGVETVFHLSGRLPDRPLSPLWEEMERMGCILDRPSRNTIRCRGKLQSGQYQISGNVSSQFISGLLFAGMLMDGCTDIQIQGKLESAPYVDMTRDALLCFHAKIDNFRILGSYPLHSPGKIVVEGDWSNAAFFLGANALGSHTQISNLDVDSAQGDRTIVSLLNDLEQAATTSVSDVPDLVPILSVVAAGKYGGTFQNIQRLRLKESDRVQAVANMLASLGIQTQIQEDAMTVCPGTVHGGTVDSCGDHRIAMAAAIASTVSDGPVIVTGAECVAKSYPGFWEDFKKLGGNYEQYIR